MNMSIALGRGSRVSDHPSDEDLSLGTPGIETRGTPYVKGHYRL